MKKDYIVELSEEEADELMDEHWVGELVRCKDCIHWDKGITEECENSDSVCFHNGRCKPDWFCADGERIEKTNSSEFPNG